MSPAAKPSPQQRFAQQLRKGALEMLVLQRLARAPAHGYAIIQQLRTASGGLLNLKEGTLYPILYRLEDEGCIASAWKNLAETGMRAMPRKVYTITEAGRAALAGEKAAWQEFAACVNQICREEDAR